MVEVAKGVVAEVVKVRVEVQVGVQEVGAKDAVTPAGNPEAVKETEAEVPVDKVAVAVLVMDDPLTTDLLPPLVMVKSKEVEVD